MLLGEALKAIAWFRIWISVAGLVVLARLDGSAQDTAPAMTLLDALTSNIQPLDFESCSGFQQQALQSIAFRNDDDWLMLTIAMMIGFPVWVDFIS